MGKMVIKPEVFIVKFYFGQMSLSYIIEIEKRIRPQTVLLSFGWVSVNLTNRIGKPVLR